MTFKQAFQIADPQLLEPVHAIEVRCPDELTGNIISDIQTRCGMVSGLDTEGLFTIVKAQVPFAEMHQYAPSLRSLTQGRAKFTMKFDRYAAMSAEQQRKFMEEYKKEVPEPAEVG